MKKQKKPGNIPITNDDIAPMDNPSGAIDFYMPLPDEVYKKWKK
jgi:hypothetical protein